MITLERSPYTVEAEQSTKAPAEQLTLKERHPDWPDLNVRFYFSPHGNKADIEGIEPYLEEADIYLLENMSGPKDIFDSFQEISDAPRGSKNNIIRNSKVNGLPLEGSFYEPVIRGIHNTKKALGSIDIGGDSPEEIAVRQEVEDLNARPLPKAASFDEALNEYTEGVAKLADAHNKREEIMAGQFEEEMARILEARPELKAKPNLNILISMGSYHTRLSHAFSEQGITVDRKFPSSTYTYPHQIELQRSFAYNREASRELQEKAYVQDALNGIVYSNLTDAESMNSDMFFKYMRAIVEKLTPADRENIYQHYNNDSLTSEYVNTLLESHGLKRLPTSSQELSPSVTNEQSKVTKRLRSFGRKALRLFTFNR